MSKKLTSCLLALAMTSCLKPQQHDVVAMVGESEITVKDFKDREKEYEYKPSSMTNEQQAEFKERILNEIIEEKVFLKEAVEKNIDVPKQELDAYVDQIKGDYSEKDFEKLLKSKEVSMKELRERMRTNLLLKKVTESITKQVSMPPKEAIESYYREHIEDFFEGTKLEISQIVVKTKEDAKNILDLLKKGNSFESLAKSYSLTPEGNQGGYLGWVTGGLPESVWEAAQRLALKKPSEPIASEYGFHILLVKDSKQQHMIPISEAAAQIVNVLTQQERDNIVAKWKQEMFSKVKVVRNNALLASL